MRASIASTAGLADRRSLFDLAGGPTAAPSVPAGFAQSLAGLPGPRRPLLALSPGARA